MVVKSGHHVRRCTNPESRKNCLPTTSLDGEAAEFMQRLLAFIKVKNGNLNLDFRFLAFESFIKVKNGNLDLDFYLLNL